MRIIRSQYLTSGDRGLLLARYEEDGKHVLVSIRWQAGVKSAVTPQATNASAAKRMDEILVELEKQGWRPTPDDDLVEHELDRLSASGESGTPLRPVPRESYPPRLAWPQIMNSGPTPLVVPPTCALQAVPTGTRTLCVISQSGHAWFGQHLDGEDPIEAVVQPTDMAPHAPLLDLMTLKCKALAGSTLDGVAVMENDEPVLVVTDLLRYHGEFLLDLPLWERHLLLRQAWSELSQARQLHRSWRLAGLGRRLNPVSRADLPTIRRLDAPYLGDDYDWMLFAPTE